MKALLLLAMLSPLPVSGTPLTAPGADIPLTGIARTALELNAYAVVCNSTTIGQAADAVYKKLIRMHGSLTIHDIEYSQRFVKDLRGYSPAMLAFTCGSIERMISK